MLQLIRRAASAARRAVSGRHGPGVGKAAVAAVAAVAAAVAVGTAAPTEAHASQEGTLTVNGFTTESGRGFTGFTSDSGNTAFCVQPERDYPIREGDYTYTQWDWIGDAQGLDADPHSIAYVLWKVANGEVQFETPVASTAVSIWMLYPSDKFWIDFDQEIYQNATMDYTASIYDGPGDRLSRGDRGKIEGLVAEAKAHAGIGGKWDHAGKIWYAHDAKQSVVELLPAPPKGSVEVFKRSDNEDVTNGNGCYSLEGAVYGVYKNRECTEDALVKTMTTNADGWARADDLDAGPGVCYFVKEVSHSRGYKVDTQVYEAPIGERNAVARVDSAEVPDNDPEWALVQKVDDQGITYDAEHAKDAQGASTLAGAEFTVRYYDNTDGNRDGQPVRTWVFRTDNDGLVQFDNPSAVVSGDGLFRDKNGAVIMPLGTYTFQETKAPEGYLLSDPSVHASILKQVDDKAQWENLDGWDYMNADKDVQGRAVVDQVKRGGVSLIKEDSKSGGKPQGDADLSGIKFDIISKNDKSVWVGGTEYHKGDRISGYLVTDKNGRASTPADLLPYGSYTIEESETNPSMRKTAGPQDATVSENGQVVAIEHVYKDEVVRGGVKVGKIDHESLLHEPQGAHAKRGTCRKTASTPPKTAYLRHRRLGRKMP